LHPIKQRNCVLLHDDIQFKQVSSNHVIEQILGEFKFALAKKGCMPTCILDKYKDKWEIKGKNNNK